MNITNPKKLLIYKYCLKIFDDELNESGGTASVYLILMYALKHHNIDTDWYDPFKFNKLLFFFPEFAREIMLINNFSIEKYHKEKFRQNRNLSFLHIDTKYKKRKIFINAKKSIENQIEVEKH